METKAVSLCSDGTEVVDVEFYPTACGANKVQYTRVTTVNPRAGIDASRCTWAAATSPADFVSKYVGGCGVAPTDPALAHLPMEFCTGVQPAPAAVAIGSARNAAPTQQSLAALCKCNDASLFLDSFDYHGSDLAAGTVKVDAKACCQACCDNTACKFWTWGKDNSKCWLKHSEDGMERQSNRVAGQLPAGVPNRT